MILTFSRYWPRLPSSPPNMANLSFLLGISIYTCVVRRLLDGASITDFPTEETNLKQNLNLCREQRLTFRKSDLVLNIYTLKNIPK